MYFGPLKCGTIRRTEARLYVDSIIDRLYVRDGTYLESAEAVVSSVWQSIAGRADLCDEITQSSRSI